MKAYRILKKLALFVLAILWINITATLLALPAFDGLFVLLRLAVAVWLIKSVVEEFKE